ncbi:MAG: stage III sporulation protein AE [Firmicutes bacterium]|nr:stage III sporulation protein AE [Bacillota bacterium]
MRKTLCFFLLIFIFFFTIGMATATSSAEPQGLQGLQEYWRNLEQDLKENVSEDLDFNFPLEGSRIFKMPALGEILQGITRYFFKEFFIHFHLLGKLLLLAVAAALLKNVQNAFENSEVPVVTDIVIYFLLLLLALQSFRAALDVGQNAINFMVDFMFAFVPVMLTMLASLGSVATVSIFHPIIVFTVNFFASLVRNIIFPVIFFATILSLANHFSTRFNVGKIAIFLKEAAIWSLGLLLTVFVSLTAMQGTMGTVMDAVTLKTAKFLTGSFLPVVGKVLADSLETVAGASLVLKNSVGLAGLFTLVMIVIFPLIKLLALLITYRVAAALAEPLGNSSLSNALNTMGSCLAMVFGAVAALALIFFISITIMVGAGNMMFMLR